MKQSRPKYSRAGACPEKAPTCALTFDYVDQKSATRLLDGYYEVAVLERTVPNDFAWTKDVQEELRPYACRVGGDLVAFDGSYEVGQHIARRTYGRFNVYRTKDAMLPSGGNETSSVRCTPSAPTAAVVAVEAPARSALRRQEVNHLAQLSPRFQFD